MALLKANINNQLGIIAGKYVMSGKCTDVIGGTMTAGSADADFSALLTFAPPFISAPIIIGSMNSGMLAASTDCVVSFSGVTVSNAYVHLAGTAALSACAIGIMAIGLQKL